MAGSVLAGETVLAQLAIAAAASHRQGVRGAFAIPTFRSRNTRTLAGTAPSADRYFAIPVVEVLAGSVLAEVIVRAQLAIAAAASLRQVFDGAFVIPTFRTKNTIVVLTALSADFRGQKRGWWAYRPNGRNRGGCLENCKECENESRFRHRRLQGIDALGSNCLEVGVESSDRWCCRSENGKGEHGVQLYKGNGSGANRFLAQFLSTLFHGGKSTY
jgi:hypothetical protein